MLLAQRALPRLEDPRPQALLVEDVRALELQQLLALGELLEAEGALLLLPTPLDPGNRREHLRGDLYTEIRQTLHGSFSAVSKLRSAT